MEHIEPALTKRVPAALVAAFLLQTAGALFWAGAMAERVGEVQRETQVNSAAVERVVRLETEVAGMHESLQRIETKIDRLGAGKQK